MPEAMRFRAMIQQAKPRPSLRGPKLFYCRINIRHGDLAKLPDKATFADSRARTEFRTRRHWPPPVALDAQHSAFALATPPPSHDSTPNSRPNPRSTFGYPAEQSFTNVPPTTPAHNRLSGRSQDTPFTFLDIDTPQSGVTTYIPTKRCRQDAFIRLHTVPSTGTAVVLTGPGRERSVARRPSFCLSELPRPVYPSTAVLDGNGRQKYSRRARRDGSGYPSDRPVEPSRRARVCSPNFGYISKIQLLGNLP
ncbi:hypothetical protein DFH09DRAFT_1070332 [Mycena vulgaris]|nr:hypothetical protein DFH09DRAFT_1070332 [Mycena vulgaris]